MLKCTDLLCEYLKNPIGIDETNPRFSWRIESDKINTFQTAYELKIPNLWESGKIISDKCINICLNNIVLKSKTHYKWAVRVWDNHGEVSEWAFAEFETALMSDGFSADWISCNEEKLTSCPVFRKKFSITEKTENARIYATALGNYEIYINGTRINDGWLMPGFVSANKRLPYQTYKVNNLHIGENEILIYLAPGWLRGQISVVGRNIFNLEPAIIAELSDENGIIVKTDDSWEYSNSRYITSEIYDGEIYDAGFEDSEFLISYKAHITDYPKSHLKAQNNEPIRIIDELEPIALFKTPKGETVIDFGQNMVGWVEFKVKGNKGDKVVLSFAEVLDKNNNFYNKNMRKAKNHIEYRLKGCQNEEYHPHFTFEGFRYVRVDKYPGEIDVKNFKGLVIHSDFERTGYFSCGNEMINKLFSNIIWGQKGNFVDLPTDCPQRDERLGWTGDAQVFIKTAALNYRVVSFFEKWLTDLKLDQNEKIGVPNIIPYINITKENGSAAWGDAATICPWELYRAFDDKRILTKNYESMTKWVEYMRRSGSCEYLWDSGEHFGDWLALDNFDGSYRGKTSSSFIATIFFAYSALLTSKAAKVLGKHDDYIKYQKLHENIKKAFNKKFTNENGLLTENTQTAYTLALFFDMTDNKKQLTDKLCNLIKKNNMFITTGFVGTPYICHTLSENGYTNTAYDIVLQKEYPSWLYSVSKGATTIWEHWDGIKPDGSFWSDEMNSFNHYAYGSVADWLYTKSAGINYDENEPAYKHIIFKPMPDKRFGYVKSKLKTMYGTIKSEWKYENDFILYKVEIPPNTYADFIFPNGESKRLSSGVFVFKTALK